MFFVLLQTVQIYSVPMFSRSPRPRKVRVKGSVLRFYTGGPRNHLQLRNTFYLKLKVNRNPRLDTVPWTPRVE